MVWKEIDQLFETNDGTFDGASDTWTNPVDEDTDGDNFRDGAEVNIHRTNPVNASSVSSSTLTVLFLEADGSGTAGADEIAVALLEDKFGLDKVTIMAASTAFTGDETAYGLLVLSSTPGSGDIRGKFTDSTTPIVNWEEAVADNGDGEFGASTAVMTKSITTTQIMLGDHPIATGLPEVITLYEGTIGQTNSTIGVFGTLAVVGTAATENEVTGNAMIIAIEAGDLVDPGSGTANDTAPARRVMLPWTDNALNNLTADGLTLFANALDWAVGSIGAPTGLEITGFGLDLSNPNDPVATITFNSRAGQEYTLLTSADLSVFASGVGASELDSVIATGDSTTMEIEYQVFGIPSNDLKRFFVVREGEEE